MILMCRWVDSQHITIFISSRSRADEHRKKRTKSQCPSCFYANLCERKNKLVSDRSRDLRNYGLWQLIPGSMICISYSLIHITCPYPWKIVKKEVKGANMAINWLSNVLPGGAYWKIINNMIGTKIHRVHMPLTNQLNSSLLALSVKKKFHIR